MKIFISCAPDDKEIARKIYDDLKQKGLVPWMDARDLVPGRKKKETVHKAIQESRWFLAILSSGSLSRRGQVHRQIRLALDLLDEFPDSEIFVIPVRTDDCKPGNEKLRNLQAVDLFPSYEKGFANLLRVFSPEQTRSESESEMQNKPDPVSQPGSDREKNPDIHDRLPSWVLKVSVASALCFLSLLMIIAVFIPNPTHFQIFVFRVVLSLAGAGFGATIPGFLKIDLQLWKKGMIHATGAIALFLLIYQVNPPELITSQAQVLPLPAEQKIKQPLSGVIFDENGNPLSGVTIMFPEIGKQTVTGANGKYYIEIRDEKQAEVRIIAMKKGYHTQNRYASLGNTGFNFSMKLKP